MGPPQRARDGRDRSSSRVRHRTRSVRALPLDRLDARPCGHRWRAALLKRRGAREGARSRAGAGGAWRVRACDRQRGPPRIADSPRVMRTHPSRARRIPTTVGSCGVPRRTTCGSARHSAGRRSRSVRSVPTPHGPTTTSRSLAPPARDAAQPRCGYVSDDTPLFPELCAGRHTGKSSRFGWPRGVKRSCRRASPTGPLRLERGADTNLIRSGASMSHWRCLLRESRWRCEHGCFRRTAVELHCGYPLLSPSCHSDLSSAGSPLPVLRRSLFATNSSRSGVSHPEVVPFSNRRQGGLHHR